MRGHEPRQPCVGSDKYKTAMGLEMARFQYDKKTVIFRYEFKFTVLRQGSSPAIIIIAQMYIIYKIIKVKLYLAT